MTEKNHEKSVENEEKNGLPPQDLQNQQGTTAEKQTENLSEQSVNAKDESANPKVILDELDREHQQQTNQQETNESPPDQVDPIPTDPTDPAGQEAPLQSEESEDTPDGTVELEPAESPTTPLAQQDTTTQPETVSGEPLESSEHVQPEESASPAIPEQGTPLPQDDESAAQVVEQIPSAESVELETIEPASSSAETPQDVESPAVISTEQEQEETCEQLVTEAMRRLNEVIKNIKEQNFPPTPEP